MKIVSFINQWTMNPVLGDLVWIASTRKWAFQIQAGSKPQGEPRRKCDQQYRLT